MRQNAKDHLALREVRTRKIKVQDITDALISSGYTSLDDQATALGLPRATVWTIINNKHKLARLSAKTIKCITENPKTPPQDLAAVHEYVAQTWEQPRALGLRSRSAKRF